MYCMYKALFSPIDIHFIINIKYRSVVYIVMYKLHSYILAHIHILSMILLLPLRLIAWEYTVTYITYVRKIHVIHAELILAKGSELHATCRTGERSEARGTEGHVKSQAVKIASPTLRRMTGVCF